ncbi:MAG TPA: PorV/PorQ family protein [Gemmatimonadota bacterium]|nr:PorV/PorQ family protein [Gemmatimonadota bacterium]
MRRVLRLRLLAAALVPAALAALAPPAAAQDEGEGGGLVGLALPVGARAVGQGRAAAASLGDLQALPYNPAAGAAGFERGAVTFSRFEGAEAADFASSYVAAAWAGRWGTVAGQVVLHDYGAIPITVDSPTPVGSLDVSEWVVGLTYANRWREKLSYGVTAKLYNSDLGQTDGSSTAFDLGVIYRPRMQLPFELAASLRNLGPDLEYGDSDPIEGAAERSARLPSRVRVGVRYHPVDALGLPPEYALSFSFDSESDLRELSTTSLHAGVSAVVHEVLVLRGGYLMADNPYIEDGEGDRTSGGSFGVGVRWGDFEADVARELSVSELGDETHFSVGFRF